MVLALASFRSGISAAALNVISEPMKIDGIPLISTNYYKPPVTRGGAA